MIMRPNPCNGTHWLMSPNDAKCSRSIDRMTGSKNDFGSEVTARVLVGTDAGGDGGGEDSSSMGDSDLAIVSVVVVAGVRDVMEEDEASPCLLKAVFPRLFMLS